VLTVDGNTAETAYEAAAVENVRTIEQELRRMYARSRTKSTQTAAAVHPQLDPAVYSMLMDIVAAAPVRSVDLAAQRGVSKSVISRQVSTLQILGLIERHADPTDARAAVLVLTDAGRKAARTIDAARRAYLKRLLDALSPEELGQVAHALRRLNDVLS